MSTTLLRYEIFPKEAFIKQVTQLKLVVTNPAPPGGEPIKFNGGPNGDEIEILFPVGSGDDDLVDSLNFQSNCKTPGFICGLSTGNDFFAIKCLPGAELPPEQSIIVYFDNVVVNAHTDRPPSEVAIPCKEYIGTHAGEATVSVTKLPEMLDIIAWLDPWILGQKQKATLYWQSFGGNRVRVLGLAAPPGHKEFTVPPSSFSYPVNIDSDNAIQRQFTVIISTNDQKHKEALVTLEQRSPLFTSFSSDPLSNELPIAVDQEVRLDWSSLYAVRSILKKPDTSLYDPNLPLTIVPGQDLSKNWQQGTRLPAKAEYSLSLLGCPPLATKPFAYSFKPVELAYFKFRDMDQDGKLSILVSRTLPSGWKPRDIVVLPSDDIYRLTIYQPGYPDSVFYLGNRDSVHPQIQYFHAAPKGNGYELNWVTANLKSMSLDPGGIVIGQDHLVRGNLLIDPATAPISFTLKGLGNNGEKIQSILDIGKIALSRLPANAGEPEGLFDDPDCQIVVSKLGALSHFSGPVPYPMREDAASLTAEWTFDDLWQLPPWSAKRGPVQLLANGENAAGSRQWQLQSSDGAVLASLNIELNLGGASTAARKACVQRIARHGLMQSLDNGQFVHVGGTCS